jgi:hypothetical protein
METFTICAGSAIRLSNLQLVWNGGSLIYVLRHALLSRALFHGKTSGNKTEKQREVSFSEVLLEDTAVVSCFLAGLCEIGWWIVKKYWRISIEYWSGLFRIVQEFAKRSWKNSLWEIWVAAEKARLNFSVRVPWLRLHSGFNPSLLTILLFVTSRLVQASVVFVQLIGF